MTSVFGQPSDPTPLLERFLRHEKLLGCVVDGKDILAPAVADLDFAVVVGAVSPATAASLLAHRLPVVVLVESDSELDSVRAVGDVTTMAQSSQVSGADIVLSAEGSARMVTSPAAARAAFASGADLVVYDAVTMVHDLMSTLRSGRPDADAGRRHREPVVLLSGMLGDHHVWDDVAAEIGTAALPWPARIDLDDTVPEMALSVLAEAPATFALAGHSLGAIVALEIIRQQPERVTRLALLNASARGPVQAQIDSWAEWRRRTEKGEFDAVAAELARTTLPPANRGAVLVARNEAMAQSVGPAGFQRQLAAQTSRPDSRATVGTIRVPVLVVSGELDEVCPPPLQRELVDLCPRARLQTIAGAGHMTPLERPAQVAALLLQWLVGEVSTSPSDA